MCIAPITETITTTTTATCRFLLHYLLMYPSDCTCVKSSRTSWVPVTYSFPWIRTLSAELINLVRHSSTPLPYHHGHSVRLILCTSTQVSVRDVLAAFEAGWDYVEYGVAWSMGGGSSDYGDTCVFFSRHEHEKE